MTDKIRRHPGPGTPGRASDRHQRKWVPTENQGPKIRKSTPNHPDSIKNPSKINDNPWNFLYIAFWGPHGPLGGLLLLLRLTDKIRRHPGPGTPGRASDRHQQDNDEKLGRRPNFGGRGAPPHRCLVGACPAPCLAFLGPGVA